VFKRSARYFTLALALVALTATVRTAHAQPDDPCSNPSVPCVVGGTDPQPSGSVVGGTDPQPSGSVVGGTDPQPSGSVVGGTDPQPSGGDGIGDSQSMDDLISYLMMLYGLA
jgi:hypothetical protein